MVPQPDGRSFSEEYGCDLLARRWLGEHGDCHGWTALFHDRRRQGNVARTGLKQTLYHVVVYLRIEVVDIGFDFDQLVGFVGLRALAEHQTQHVRPIGELLAARAIAYALDAEAHRRRRRDRERAQDSGAGRCDHLRGAVTHPNRETGQQFSGSRRGNWDDAVLRADEAATRGQRRNDHFAEFEPLEAPGCCHDVYDRVDRADLVEMNLLG